jgi:hypothetical protein
LLTLIHYEPPFALLEMLLGVAMAVISTAGFDAVKLFIRRTGIYYLPVFYYKLSKAIIK